MCVCVCVCVCIYVRFQSKCVPSQQWCFSESPPPLAEWGLPDAETCTAARPSRQLDRYKRPHQDATLAQCPTAPCTDRRSPLAAAWSTCFCNQYDSSSFIKHITILGDEAPCRGGMSSDVSNGKWIQNIRHRSHSNTAAHCWRLEASATPYITFKIILKRRIITLIWREMVNVRHRYWLPYCNTIRHTTISEIRCKFLHW